MDEPALDYRDQRGRQIAGSGVIKRSGRHWIVPSQSQTTTGYVVDLEAAACTCPDFELRKGTCKHQHAVLYWIAWGRDVSADGVVTETVTVKRKTYPQKDWSAYNASQHHEKEYVMRLGRALCDGIEQPARKPGAGRNRRPVSDAMFAALMKTYTGLSGRRLISDLDLCVAQGLLPYAGHENSILNFLGDPTTTTLLVPIIEHSAAPLRMIENGQFAIDSTGFSTVNYDRWFDEKHGKLQARHPWVKLHVVVGTVTHAIVAVNVTSKGDSPQLPELVARAREHFDVKELSADKAYSAVRNLKVLDAFGVQPFIPFKENAVINPKSPTWSRHLAEFVLNRDKFLAHYHRRSNVETVFAMIKKKFGAAVRSKRAVAQTNEVLMKCLAHNLCCLTKAIFMSGLAPTFWPEVPRTPSLQLVAL